jgi:hypothetical protein
VNLVLLIVSRRGPHARSLSIINSTWLLSLQHQSRNVLWLGSIDAQKPGLPGRLQGSFDLNRCPRPSFTALHPPTEPSETAVSSRSARYTFPHRRIRDCTLCRRLSSRPNCRERVPCMGTGTPLVLPKPGSDPRNTVHTTCSGAAEEVVGTATTPLKHGILGGKFSSWKRRSGVFGPGPRMPERRCARLCLRYASMHGPRRWFAHVLPCLGSRIPVHELGVTWI